MAHLDGACEQVTQRLAGFDLRFDSIERKIGALRAELLGQIKGIDDKVDRRFMWTIGVVVGTWLTTILAIFLRH